MEIGMDYELVWATACYWEILSVRWWEAASGASWGNWKDSAWESEKVHWSEILSVEVLEQR